MSVGLVGRKCGMTRIFTESGESVPVTVIEALPNRVTTLKTAERDGYTAVQVTVGAAPPIGSRSRAGHFAGAGRAGQGLWEFRSGRRGRGRASAEIKVDSSRRASSSTSRASRRARATRA